MTIVTHTAVELTRSSRTVARIRTNYVNDVTHPVSNSTMCKKAESNVRIKCLRKNIRIPDCVVTSCTIFC